MKPGYLWIIVVHANYTNLVDEAAVKSGSLGGGNPVNCKLLDVEVAVGCWISQDEGVVQDLTLQISFGK